MIAFGIGLKNKLSEILTFKPFVKEFSINRVYEYLKVGDVVKLKDGKIMIIGDCDHTGYSGFEYLEFGISDISEVANISQLFDNSDNKKM